MKRADAPEVVENPFIKVANKSWTVGPPASLEARVSPPRSRRTTKNAADDTTAEDRSIGRGVSDPDPRAESTKETEHDANATTANVECGDVALEDPVSFFSSKLAAARCPEVPGIPRLSHEGWLDLYRRNQHPHGRHFVIHQHDHPVAGTHYDLRLQCNATSSISWACMYGLPGDPNSRRLKRNATETRVHNLWNHLIETASHATGTMLIWDTGEYSVLPYHDRPVDSDAESGHDEGGGDSTLTDSEKLHQAFRQRKIRLRLHGARLPSGYTIAIRGDRDDFPTEQPKRPARKRRRKDTGSARRRKTETSSSDDGSGADQPRRRQKDVESLHRIASPPRLSETADEDPHAPSEEESETIRLTNAYTGATNDIGSVHQRKWYISMDRASSGFEPVWERRVGTRTWTRKREPDGTLHGFQRFWVMGREVERSVVTGRLAKDILEDEGVEGYVPRGRWRPVIE